MIWLKFFACLARVSAFVVVGYLPEWRYGSADFDAIARHVTHLVFFSIEIDSEGRPSAQKRLPSLRQLEEAHAARTAHGVKLLVSVGGQGRSSGFPIIARDKTKRKRFLRRLKALLDIHAFDGVDYNWESPTNDEDWRGWANLLKETWNLLKPQGKIVTIAYHPGGQEKKLASLRGASGGVMQYIDLAHSMAYDFPGRHSTFELAQQVIDLWRQENLPLSKLTLGIPFYGRHTRTGNPKTFQEMHELHGSRVMDSDEVDGYFFNSPRTILKKATLARKEKLGGIMIWELGQDVRGPSSLLATISRPRDEL